MGIKGRPSATDPAYKPRIGPGGGTRSRATLKLPVPPAPNGWGHKAAPGRQAASALRPIAPALRWRWLCLGQAAFPMDIPIWAHARKHNHPRAEKPGPAPVSPSGFAAAPLFQGSKNERWVENTFKRCLIYAHESGHRLPDASGSCAGGDASRDCRRLDSKLQLPTLLSQTGPRPGLLRLPHLPSASASRRCHSHYQCRDPGKLWLHDHFFRSVGVVYYPFGEAAFPPSTPNLRARLIGAKFSRRNKTKKLNNLIKHMKYILTAVVALAMTFSVSAGNKKCDDCCKGKKCAECCGDKCKECCK